MEKTMYLYLLAARLHRCATSYETITSMRAAGELMKECYGARCRGMFGNLGLVYMTDFEISAEHMDFLGVTVWN